MRCTCSKILANGAPEIPRTIENYVQLWITLDHEKLIILHRLGNSTSAVAVSRHAVTLHAERAESMDVECCFDVRLTNPRGATQRAVAPHLAPLGAFTGGSEPENSF
jgi:hypothetical protein